jgi:hypothetical protein
MEVSGVRRSDMEAVPGRKLVEERRRKKKSAPLKTDASTAPPAIAAVLWAD